MKLAHILIGVVLLLSMPDEANKGKVAEKAREAMSVAGCEVAAIDFEPTESGLLMIARCREMKSDEQRKTESK